MNDLDALWAFLVAAVVALLLTPQTARLARRVGAVALPRERDLHDSPMPWLGGLAILAGVLGAGGVGGVLVAGLLFLPGPQAMRGILAGAVAIAFVGAVDDAKPGGLNPVV